MNLFRAAQSMSFHSPPLELELLTATQVFCAFSAFGCFGAQAVYTDNEWSLQVNSDENAFRNRPSHRLPSRFFRFINTYATEETREVINEAAGSIGWISKSVERRDGRVLEKR